MIPGIDGDRVDYKYINGASLRGLKGLSRFIKVAMEMGGSTTENFVFHDTGERLVERPCFPTEIKPIRQEILSEATPDEILVRYQTSGYDALPEELLVPEFYANHDLPLQVDWYTFDFPIAQHTRDQAIETIIHCRNQEPPEGIPRKMKDAWSTEKRSREYLNDDMDKIDLDTVYYAAAYKD
jgi:hypothetical protein